MFGQFFRRCKRKKKHYGNKFKICTKKKKQHTRMKSKTIGCKQHFGTELFSALIISANGTSQNSKLYTKIIALLLSLIEPHTHV